MLGMHNIHCVSFLSLCTTLNSATVLFLNVKTLKLERVLVRL